MLCNRMFPSSMKENIAPKGMVLNTSVNSVQPAIKKFPPPVLSENDALRIVTSNGHGDNKCCKRVNCFLQKLNIDQATVLVKR